ncbi:DUF397 domain-containing protein [Spirillospora sp. NPDC048911]|uniref:DUF397 domain-containing protein n=1 Tax=Spirillospora sp. NPDC048911 TaxID=3364527 RepID=UPI00371E7606
MSTQHPIWRKSRHSEADGNCVEVSRAISGMIGVRDSKRGDAGPILELTRAEWAAFLRSVR